MTPAHRTVASARHLVASIGAVLVAALVSLATLAPACSSPPADARFVATPPDTTSFPPVALMLIQACGTLDCHGTVGRNLRLYGNTGLRYSPTDVPTALTPTTDDEIAQDYLSIVGLEPEIMSAVVASGGANPERLTFVRKARGEESHKGGVVITPPDARNICLTTWLAGQADPSACTAALKLP
jgi:hypothetical protein